ncbi:UDP-glucose 4-epimerase GalE [uncultured Pseudodesulfovibrio sp.]|uniref:UDP-glucose 4-epimerase GalE n=1 Tax=uncultured Pseudodesulfovibrio sp. TaxID=2035858 RepID=UPI0029C93B4F|nr:UDP-glucose 4-epimerase GalE [uncultured Pseudodesulfovibrio sp.]
MKIQKVLVSGGAGYIGTHTCIELLAAGYEVVCADNFNNSSPEAMKRVEQITGTAIPVHRMDFCNLEEVKDLFQAEAIDAAIHFAGYKAVGESVQKPLMYYENNLLSLINLCKVMGEGNGKNIVFSSSATVYGLSDKLPLTEETPTSAYNPYGRTKLYIEEILKDLHAAEPDWNMSILRYFNPVGAHPSGLIGEDPTGIPNNLMPYIAQVAVGRLEQLSVYGDDYDTPDGTGVRDFIHVVDLARGHVAALRKLEEEPGYVVHNLGTGKGCSVLELVHAFERINNVSIPYRITDRRPGDVAANYASTDKARNELGWEATHTIEDMVRDTWNWQSKNPQGYRDADG